MHTDGESNKENSAGHCQPQTVKLRTVDDVYGRCMESLKPKNTPDDVNHRSLEKTKITNFLRK